MVVFRFSYFRFPRQNISVEEIISFLLPFHLRFVARPGRALFCIRLLAENYFFMILFSKERRTKRFRLKRKKDRKNAAEKEEIVKAPKVKMNPENHQLHNTNNRAESSS